LYLGNTKFVDLGLLKDMKNMKKLHLNNTNISDLSPLHNLDKLTYLNLRGCMNLNFSSLEGFSNIESIDLPKKVDAKLKTKFKKMFKRVNFR
jgi:Leucine-rich repeat (LRR) protein